MMNEVQRAVSKITGAEVEFILYWEKLDESVRVKYRGIGKDKTYTMALESFREYFDILDD